MDSLETIHLSLGGIGRLLIDQHRVLIADSADTLEVCAFSLRGASVDVRRTVRIADALFHFEDLRPRAIVSQIPLRDGYGYGLLLSLCGGGGDAPPLAMPRHAGP